MTEKPAPPASPNPPLAKNLPPAPPLVGAVAPKGTAGSEGGTAG